jgi:hypothetical protein
MRNSKNPTINTDESTGLMRQRTREDIINHLVESGLNFNEDDELQTESDNNSHSGSYATLNDFVRIGWDTSY